MSGKGTEREIQAVAEAVTGLLAEAVKETIGQRSPQPARECTAELVAVDRRAAPDDDGGPAELMATLGLVRWAALAREELGQPEPVDDGTEPEWIERVLAWIEEALGKRYRARSRYVAGALRSEAAAGEIVLYTNALREDFLPALIWLIAGVVAVHGGGDVAWLRDRERAAAAARPR